MCGNIKFRYNDPGSWTLDAGPSVSRYTVVRALAFLELTFLKNQRIENAVLKKYIMN